MSNSLLPSNDKNTERKVIQWIFWFSLIALTLQFWRIFSLNATYDQGLFLQELWNGLYGRPFESTLAAELSAPVKFNQAIPHIGYLHLAQHFTPLLLAWIPLVGLLGIWALPLIQVCLIALAGWVLFQLGKEHLPSKLAGWITCSFFVTGTVIGPTLENFHDLCLVPLIVFSLLLGISRKNISLYLCSALLLPLIREDVGLLSFGIGLWMICKRPSWRFVGFGLCLYSIIAVLIITNYAMPSFGTELKERFMQERFGQYLNGEKGGTIEVLQSMVSNPKLLLKELFTPFGSTIRFLITLALPLAFIPWLSDDSWLLISGPLFVALSSQGGNALSVHLRFVLYLVPGIFSGAVFWWSKHTYLFNNSLLKNIWKSCLVISFIFALAGNPHRSLSAIIPDSVTPWVHIPIQKQLIRGLETRNLLKVIPINASVAAETHLIPQLATRRVLMRFPENYKFLNLQKEVELVDIIISQPRFNASYSKAFEHQARWLKESIRIMKELVNDKSYGVLACSSKGIILEKQHLTSSRERKCFEKEIEIGTERLNELK